MKALTIVFILCIIACFSCSKDSIPKTDNLIAAIQAVGSKHYLYESIDLHTVGLTTIHLKSKTWSNPNDTRQLLELIMDTVQYHPIPGHTINFGIDDIWIATIVFRDSTPVLSYNHKSAIAIRNKQRANQKQAQVDKEKQLLYRRRVITPSEIEDFFLNDLKWDTKVRSFGEGCRSISIRYALMSRVWANELSKSALMDRLRQDGYKRVVFTDGYDYKISYSL